MNPPGLSRRTFLRAGSATALAAVLSPAVKADPAEPVATIASEPAFELSPYLYMQFMEPLGTTDGSVEASWDHLKTRWRPDLIEVTKVLAPPMMRWGGLLSAYYRWREGVGPRDRRKPMHNLVWGGVESNQVGTLEFLDFCQQVKAEPLMCVNFEAEGYPPWAKNALGDVRAGDAQEAAEWVRYCNDPKNADRVAHGQREPMPIRFWQIGNETSYSKERFKKSDAIAKTLEFAQAMRQADESIKLVAWGDSGWAPDMIKEAGGRVDYVAFHHLFDPGSPCSDGEFRKDLDKTWDVLMASVRRQEKKILEVRQQAGKFPLALTESHFTMKGRDRCDLNSAWAVGVAYARFMNLHQRHGDVLKIANLGDFCGTRWQSNVVMIPTPTGKSYLMPVGKVASLYRNHTGTHSARVNGAPPELDVVASRTGDTFFVHVVNTSRTKAQSCRIAVEGLALKTGKAFEISAVDPFAEVTSSQDDPMTLKTRDVDPLKGVTFPAASVTAVELRA